MDTPTQVNQTVLTNPNETNSSPDLLSAIIERMDSLGSVSKALLCAFGKCVGDGITKACKPASIYLEGKARVAVEAYKIERIAKAEAEADLVKSQAKAKQLQIDLDASEAVLDRVKSRFMNKELFHQRNIEAIIAESVQIAETESREEIASHIDESWMWKFIEGAQGVSEAELRTLWARLLSGHATSGGIKPAVLDALRLFDKEMAQDFRQVSILSALYDGFFPTLTRYPQDEAVSGADVTLDRVEALVDAGVMIRSDHRNITDYDVSFVMHIVAQREMEEQIYISPYFLNGVGMQLANILYGPIHYKHSIRNIQDRNRLINRVGLECCSSYIRNMVWCIAINNGTRNIGFQYSVEFNESKLDTTTSPLLHLTLMDYLEKDSLVIPENKRDMQCYWLDVSTFLNTIKKQRDCATIQGAEDEHPMKDTSMDVCE